MELGYRLQDERRACNISVEELANKTSMSIGSIRSYEQGRRIPSVTALKSLLTCLDLKGKWISETVWKSPDDEEYNLTPFRGGHTRRVQKENENLRVQTIREILDADSETLELINLVLRKTHSSSHN